MRVMQHWLSEVVGCCNTEFTYLDSVPARVWHAQVLMLTAAAALLHLCSSDVANYTAAAERCNAFKEANSPADTGNVSTKLPV